MYLAVFLDLFSRRVVGWALGTHLTADLVLRALKQAILIRRPPPGLIIHTDRGSHYTSDAFIELVQQDQFTMSMIRKGNCWDYAVVESFFATLKRELMVAEKIRYRYQLKEMVTDYIDRYYNQVRTHSTLDYKSPMEFEKQRA
jgi:putative transposase